MGFKKTEKGNLIYEFDFTPTKLVPLKKEECGYDRSYAVEGAGGERAPVAFVFQGDRHGNYALVFGFISQGDASELGINTDMCVCSNQTIVATFAKLAYDWQNSWDEQKESYGFDPTQTDTLAKDGITFPIMSLADASKYYEINGIPRDGYDILRERMS